MKKWKVVDNSDSGTVLEIMDEKYCEQTVYFSAGIGHVGEEMTLQDLRTPREWEFKVMEWDTATQTVMIRNTGPRGSTIKFYFRFRPNTHEDYFAIGQTWHWRQLA